MFNDLYYLTQSTLDGYKTNTRRIEPCCKFIPDAIATGYNSPELIGNTLRLWKENTFIEFKIRYQVGEVVAIAQSYKDCGYGENWYLDEKEDKEVPVDWRPDFSHKYGDMAGWKNKMFVRAELMPHRIKITGIKLERLQDIGKEDCLKEGIIPSPNNIGDDPCDSWYLSENSIGYGRIYYSPIDAFSKLIDLISGKGTWESNPYVIAYEFEVIK